MNKTLRNVVALQLSKAMRISLTESYKKLNDMSIEAKQLAEVAICTK